MIDPREKLPYFKRNGPVRVADQGREPIIRGVAPGVEAWDVATIANLQAVTGTNIYTGAGVPTDILFPDAEVGDYVIDTLTGNWYEKTGVNTYTFELNLQGPAGADGTDGIDGSTILNGIINPTGGTGVNGDYYINTHTGDMFFKSGGVWTEIMSVIGADAANVARWEFQYSLTPVGDPGAGNYESTAKYFNYNKTIHINSITQDGADCELYWDAVLQAVNAGRVVYLRMSHIAHPERWGIHTVSSIVYHNTGADNYYEIVLLAFAGNATSIYDGDHCAFSYVIMGKDGDPGLDGNPGEPGPAGNSVAYEFVNTGAASDPGLYRWGSDSTDLATTSQIAVNVLDYNNVDQYINFDMLKTMLDSGRTVFLKLSVRNSPGITAIYGVTSVTYNNSGGDNYFLLEVVLISGNGHSLNLYTIYDFGWIFSGLDGAAGLQGVHTPYSIRHTLSGATGGAPSSGNVNTNNLSTASITTLDLSQENYAAINHYDMLNTILNDYNNGRRIYLKIEKLGDPTIFGFYLVNGASIYGGSPDVFYYDLSLITSNGAFAINDVIITSFQPVGRDGTNGNDGANSVRWLLLATTLSGDPGSGYFRANASNLTTSTVTFHIDILNSSGFDVTGWLEALRVKFAAGYTCYLRIERVAIPSIPVFAIYEVTACTDNTGYYAITGNRLAGSGSINTNETYSFSWIFDGKDGAAGAPGTDADIGLIIALG